MQSPDLKMISEDESELNSSLKKESNVATDRKDSEALIKLIKLGNEKMSSTGGIHSSQTDKDKKRPSDDNAHLYAAGKSADKWKLHFTKVEEDEELGDKDRAGYIGGRRRRNSEMSKSVSYDGSGSGNGNAGKREARERATTICLVKQTARIK